MIELTSGNTGTGLALACRAMGHPFVAVISKGNTIERARMMQALGAEVIRVEQATNSPPNQVSGEDLSFVEDRTREIVSQRHAFRADQFLLEGNVLAREEGIFGGFSAGANLAGALQVLEANPGKTIAFLICDSGLKYLSTDLYPSKED